MKTQADQLIGDFATFEALTAEPREVARLYFYATIDPLFELAYRVSCDFFKRPHIYTRLGKTAAADGKSRSVAALLAELRARTAGGSEFFPPAAQRSEIYGSIFGDASASSTAGFSRLRDEVIRAATAFAERAAATSMDMLRERFRTAVRRLARYLNAFQGDSLKWSANEAFSSLTEVSFAILRGAGVASIFGVATPPSASWPYVEDPNADKLIEAISDQLALDGSGKVDAYSIESWSSVHRAALMGTQTLASLVEFESTKNEMLDRLITLAYSWGCQLAAADAPGITRAPALPGVSSSSSGSIELYSALAE